MSIFLQYKRFAIVLVTLVFFAACEKQDLPAKPVASDFSAAMENSITSFPATGGTGNILVKGGTNGWWVTMPTNTWCVITKLYGAAEFKIPVTVKTNTTGVAREINVVLHPTFGLEPVTINLKQTN